MIIVAQARASVWKVKRSAGSLIAAQKKSEYVSTTPSKSWLWRDRGLRRPLRTPGTSMTDGVATTGPSG
jgi:hypothetical protein